jgi:hypothetical protein
MNVEAGVAYLALTAKLIVATDPDIFSLDAGSLVQTVVRSKEF